jgi:hypothetical protein
VTVAEKLPEAIEIWVACSGCRGKGRVTESHERITKAAMPLHVKNHAYTRDESGNIIGANCDCPRTTVSETKMCINCQGSGQVLAKLRIPRPGTKVNILDKKLLTSIFGEGDEPEEPGVVFDAQTPDEHNMELKTGIGVRVTWDRLTKYGKIPKGKEVELWTFDLTEVKIA